MAGSGAQNSQPSPAPPPPRRPPQPQPSLSPHPRFSVTAQPSPNFQNQVSVRKPVQNVSGKTFRAKLSSPSPQPSPAQISKIRFQSENLVKTFRQNFPRLFQAPTATAAQPKPTPPISVPAPAPAPAQPSPAQPKFWHPNPFTISIHPRPVP